MFQYMFYVFSFFHHTFVDHAREAGKRLAREKVLHPESARPGASVTAIMQQMTVIAIQHSQYILNVFGLEHQETHREPGPHFGKTAVNLQRRTQRCRT